MTNIVERLRGDYNDGIKHKSSAIKQEAADEIERLRLGALATIVREQGFEIERLRADNGRLRILLGKLRWEIHRPTRYILDEIRAALEPKP